MLKERDCQITIARKYFPALRATAMKDFFQILRGIGAYYQDWHNKTENIYYYEPTNTEVEFFSIDIPTKVRSRRRQYLWLNEANEFDKEDFEQLNMRTDKQIFMDYNPSHLFHWIYEDLQNREDSIVIPSTYKDNPFLPKELIREIESYRTKDQNYWRIYGLGLKGITEALIYTHWQYCDKEPENPDKVYFGLDFGYNSPTALTRVTEKDKDLYWREMLYERYLTNQDLYRSEKEALEKGKEIGRLHKLVKEEKLKYTDIIYADSAEPQRIAELKAAGFNIVGCVKIPVQDGINLIKSRNFFIIKDSVNLQKEARVYSWKVKDGKPLEEPVKENDHLLDGGRYAVTSEMKLKPSAFPSQNKGIKDVTVERRAKPDSAGLLDKEF